MTMIKMRNCWHCGTRFVAENDRCRYCSAECKMEERKERKRLAKVKSRKPTNQANVTIDMMVDAMLRLSAERGKPVQYGDIQTGLVTGKLKVKGGVIK